MRFSLGAFCLFLALLAPQGASARRVQSPPPKPQAVKEGKLQVVRGIRRPEAQLTDSSGKRWLLVGPLRSELLRLHGHHLRVYGSSAPSNDPAKLATFTVKRYELTRIAGRRPQVGRLASQGITLSLVQRDRTLRVIAKKPMAKRLRRVVGCKVWLLGDVDKSTIKVFKYGKITCEKRSPIKAKKEKMK